MPAPAASPSGPVAICITIDEFCIKNDGFCIKNDRFKCKRTGSHILIYQCQEQEFIPSPKDPTGKAQSEVLAKIKAETVPFEFIGDVGDVMLYHHCMVHSTGINTSQSIRMSCIQDFTRVKPRNSIMWYIDGAEHSPGGIVSFKEEPESPEAAGDLRCSVLWHHDTIEWGPTQPTSADMWKSWNLGEKPAVGNIVDEDGWWDRYGLEFPVKSKTLRDVATLGADGVWRMDRDRAIGQEVQVETGEDAGR